MISIFMRKIFAFLFLTIGVLACTPQDPPLEEETNPEEEIPAPDPEPEPEPEPEPRVRNVHSAAVHPGGYPPIDVGR